MRRALAQRSPLPAEHFLETFDPLHVIALWPRQGFFLLHDPISDVVAASAMQ